MTTPGKMFEVSSAIRANGFDARTDGNIIFSEGWGIFCSLTGRVEARLLDDTCIRGTIGMMSEPAEELADKFLDFLATF